MHRIGGSNDSTRPAVTSRTPNEKYKMELCKNILAHGFCRFGEDCHFAHNVEEQERYKQTAEDLMKAHKLLLPCLIMMMTGHW